MKKMIYFKNNTLTEVKSEIQATLTSKKNALELWEKVAFCTKKDGSEFANIGKNFEGARIDRGDTMPQIKVFADYLKPASEWDRSIYISLCRKHHRQHKQGTSRNRI